MKKNVLLFPCGSEIAMEIYRSLQYSTHFNVIGGSSVDDHGRFIYENYFGNFPFITDDSFIPFIKSFIKEHRIDIIYPALDNVITKLKELESELNCIVVSSCFETTKICLSKELTYNTLKDKVLTPKIFSIETAIQFPVFIKPIIGYGSRGAKRIDNQQSMIIQLKEYPESIITEYLPGEEYTVDCFTDKNGVLRFCGARLRKRISNGISVNTLPVDDTDEKFIYIATTINNNIKFRGAWFLQLKKDVNGELVLLEIASRLGGSSALFRNKGVNFALLSIFDALGYDVEIFENNYKIELDRALDNKYKIDIKYSTIYVDFDDCIVIENKININLIKFIYKSINQKIKIILLTKHENNLVDNLKKYRLESIFDEIIHIPKSERKSDYINDVNSIFIDDSFTERYDVFINHHIPVFSPDMVECLTL